jgi:cytochrome c oxidase subunit 1
VSLGFILTFTPQFLLGNAGMPRRYATYPPRYQWLHVLSTAGAFLLALGMATTLAYLIYAFVRGKRVGANPWGSRSFEWRSPAPPPHDNFETPPEWTVGAYSYDEELP